MFLPPYLERSKQGTQFEAFAGQRILGPRRVVGIEASLDDLAILKQLQPGRQRIRTDSRQRQFQILEFSRTVAHKVTQDQQCPTITDDFQRSRYRATRIRT